MTTCLCLAVVLSTLGGTIVQTTGFHEDNHNPLVGSYNQFNPALGPLNEVVTTVTLNPYGIDGTGNAYFLTNQGAVAISFHATIWGTADTDGGKWESINNQVPMTLGAFSQSLVFPIDVPKSFQTTQIRTSNLSGYIGTGQLLTGAMDPGGNQELVSVDDFRVSVRPQSALNITGIETVTYYYGSSFAVPEPASVVGMALGLAVVAGMAWRRRWTLIKQKNRA